LHYPGVNKLLINPVTDCSNFLSESIAFTKALPDNCSAGIFASVFKGCPVGNSKPDDSRIFQVHGLYSFKIFLRWKSSTFLPEPVVAEDETI
jgi:hypothetical protein